MALLVLQILPTAQHIYDGMGGIMDDGALAGYLAVAIGLPITPPSVEYIRFLGSRDDWAHVHSHVFFAPLSPRPLLARMSTCRQKPNGKDHYENTEGHTRDICFLGPLLGHMKRRKGLVILQ